MKNMGNRFFKPLPLLSPGRALLLRILMLPNYFFIKAHGLENLAGAQNPRIYAFNHNNSAEAVMVPVFLFYQLGGCMMTFVVDWMYGKLPVLGALLKMSDPVYVYNKRSTIRWIEAQRPRPASRNTVELCCEKIQAGRSIGIFPEGRRNRNPETLERAKPGIGHIALQSGVEVVPVGIDFRSRITKRKIPAFGRIILRIGAPLRFAQHASLYRALMADQARSTTAREAQNCLAAEATRTIMLSLARLSGKRYQEKFISGREAF